MVTIINPKQIVPTRYTYIPEDHILKKWTRDHPNKKKKEKKLLYTTRQNPKAPTSKGKKIECILKIL